MKNIKIALCIGLVLSCFAFSANAGVQFLPSMNGVGQKKPAAALPSGQICKNKGYKITNCGAAQKACQPCSDNKKYFKFCCPKNYLFTKEECLNKGLSYSSDSCCGFYKCI